MTDSPKATFNRQFSLDRSDYLAGLDFYTWMRHYNLFKDVLASVQGDLLEVGTGDGVLKRCVQPFVRSYTVMDINQKLDPDVPGDLSEHSAELVDSFDAIVVAEVLEHLPFEKLAVCVAHLRSYLRAEGRLFLTLPHRKSHMLLVTPRQRQWLLRFPVGLLSLSEAYHRFVRRKIWIDPHHCWEIGDGRVNLSHIDRVLHDNGFAVEKFDKLPYCDYWVVAAAPNPPTR